MAGQGGRGTPSLALPRPPSSSERRKRAKPERTAVRKSSEIKPGKIILSLSTWLTPWSFAGSQTAWNGWLRSSLILLSQAEDIEDAEPEKECESLFSTPDRGTTLQQT